MKYLLFMLPMLVMAGTPRQNPVKRAYDFAPPVYPQIMLSWQPNYNQGFENFYTNVGALNEDTVIIASPDITIDRSQWAEVFEGHTNRCCLPRTSDKEYFCAYNCLTND